MALPVEKQDTRLMREMFSSIAPRYDFFTRVFSFGMDRKWKVRAVEWTDLPHGASVLDLASGTGDFTLMLTRKRPDVRSVAADLTFPMLTVARRHGVERTVCSDAMRLPFASASFDCVFVGYGLRNFPKLEGALAEIDRVIKPGGMLVSLDFFLPANPILRRLFLTHLYLQGWLFGLLLHGRPRTYTYIADSIASWISMDDYRAVLERVGYATIRARRFLFGGIGLHWAHKSPVK